MADKIIEGLQQAVREDLYASVPCNPCDGKHCSYCAGSGFKWVKDDRVYLYPGGPMVEDNGDG